MPLRDDTPEPDLHPSSTELERVVLAEVRRIGRAIDALTEKVDQKFEALSRDTKAEDEKLEARVRVLEVSDAKTNTKMGFIAAIASIVAAGAVEAMHLLSAH